MLLQNHYQRQRLYTRIALGKVLFSISWQVEVMGKYQRVNTQSSHVNRVPRSLLEGRNERDRIINLCDIHENHISSWECLDSSTWIFCITLAHREHVVTSGKMVTTWNVKVASVALSDTCCFHNS
jgi:hypothetical protein